jgi:hypothetical protein
MSVMGPSVCAFAIQMGDEGMSSDVERVQCPNCGAAVRSGEDACRACGAPLPQREYLAEVRWSGLRDFIEKSNQSLSVAGTNAAESAFGLGCWLGLLISLLLVGIAFGLGLRNLVILGILFAGTAIVVTSVSVVLSTRAKSATVSGTYRRDVEPGIRSYLHSHRITREEFDGLADEILGEDAPLRKYISKSTMKDGASAKE